MSDEGNALRANLDAAFAKDRPCRACSGVGYMLVTGMDCSRCEGTGDEPLSPYGDAHDPCDIERGTMHIG